MIKAENRSNSRSVEHLIPNTALTRKRKNDEGDFYACRRCNSRKSSIDYILGVVSKAQSVDGQLAAATLIDAVTRNKGNAKRIIDMVRTAETGVSEIYMEMPIKGEELIDYIHFLGKGQFFKANGVPYNSSEYVMRVEFINKQVLASLETSYAEKAGTNSFKDLQRNPFSEVINNGECIIYSRDNRFLFVFHNYTAIIVEVLRRTPENVVLAVEREAFILKHFDYPYAGQTAGDK